MAIKLIEVPELGYIHLQRKRGLKNISLRVSASGQVRVSAPWLVPRQIILNFVKSKHTWIKIQQDKLSHTWQSGHQVTPILSLQIEPTDNLRASKHVNTDSLVLFIPEKYSGVARTKYIEKCITDAQKMYCETVITRDLRDLSNQQDLNFSYVTVKSLKSRWGSCDQKKRIVLNTHLASLPSRITDYVLAHELAHTIHLNHSPKFWQLVEQIEPDYKALRKQLRGVQPAPRPYQTFMP